MGENSHKSNDSIEKKSMLALTWLTIRRIITKYRKSFMWEEIEFPISQKKLSNLALLEITENRSDKRLNIYLEISS